MILNTPTVNIDYETWSTAPLKTVGARRYIADPSTRFLMMAWWVSGDLDAELWLPGDPFPDRLRLALAMGARVCGWNSDEFERHAWRMIGVPQHGFPPLDDDNWDDAMHQAAAANLPRSLEKASEAVGAAVQKDKDGHRLMLEVTDGNKTPWSQIEEWMADAKSARALNPSSSPGTWTLLPPAAGQNKLTRLFPYCLDDVRAERFTGEKMPAWPNMTPWSVIRPIHRAINDRGVLMDASLVAGLEQIATIELGHLDKEMAVLTRGGVPKTSNVGKLKDWLVSRGIELPRVDAPLDDDEDDEDENNTEEGSEKAPRWRMRKTDIVDILSRDDVPEDCRLALTLRMEAAKVSVSKLRSMRSLADADGRLRGSLGIMAAQQTGRWASAARWNPYNFPRDVVANPDEVAKTNGLTDQFGAIPKENKPEVHRMAALSLNSAIGTGRSGDPELVRMLFGVPRKNSLKIDGVLRFVSRMLRRTLAAPAGKQFLNGDFAQVEARITDWLAQQIHMLMAWYRDDDIYRLTAAPIYGKAPEALTKMERQIGKVTKLACGFGGGVNALLAMAFAYGIRLSREESDPVVKAYRTSNAEVVRYWYASMDAAINAVMYPGHEFHVAPLGLVSYFMHGGALCARLPSGRLLRYWAPQLHKSFWPDGKERDRPGMSVLRVKGRAVFRSNIWHGRFVENCLAGDTKVVTRGGVKRVVDVLPDDMLWDGQEWVRHDGLVYQGVRQTRSFGGVRMTPDHKVMTDADWKANSETTYDCAVGAYGRYRRPANWRPDCGTVPGNGRSPGGLADTVLLRKHQADGGAEFSQQRCFVVRLQDGRAAPPAEAGVEDTRHVEAPSIRGVAVHGRPVQSSDSQSVEELRGSRHNGLRRVGGVRAVLGGHGADLCNRSDDRASGQQRRIQREELLLGNSKTAGAEHANERMAEYAMGAIDGSRSVGEVRDRADYSVREDTDGLARDTRVRATGFSQPVFDILNAGPRHRFTVVCPNGDWILVSNCVQAIGVDLLANGLMNMDAAGIPAVMHVYDSVAGEVDERDAERLLPVFKEAMLYVPAWAKGLPMGADCDISARFG